MATSTSLLAGLATDNTLNAVLQKTTDVLTAVTGQASPTADQIAAAIKDVQPNDYALQTTLAAILQKQIVNPATDTSIQQVVSGLSGLATQTTLAAVLAKLPSTPATDTPHSTTAPSTVVAGSGLSASQANTTDAQLLSALMQVVGTSAGLPHQDQASLLTAVQALGTQTTLAAILAKLPSSPATDTPHSTTTAATAVAGTGLTGGQSATDAVLLNAIINLFGSTSGLPHTDSAAILAKLTSDPATQTTLAALNSKTSSDQATQTTLAAVLSKLPASPALDASVQSVVTALGTGGATGLAKLEDSARASGDRGTPVLGVRGTTTPTARTDAAGDYGFMQLDAEGRLVVTQGAIPDLTWQNYQVMTTTTAAAIAAARGAGIRNYLRTLVISASQPTTGVAHLVTVLDGTTVIHRQQIPATVTTNAINFEPPLRSSANAALNVQLSAANSAGTAVTATGYQGL